MIKEKILIVEDEEDIQELLDSNLVREGYRTTGVASGEAALQIINDETFDLVVLDLMLPGMDGKEVCQTLKKDPETINMPVIMLSTNEEETEELAGIENRADDYITKPINPEILITKINDVLMNFSEPRHGDKGIKVFDNLTLLPQCHEIRINDEPVSITMTEFRILSYLAKRPGWVFSRDDIIDEVQGEVTDNTVDVQIVGLREKLGAEGQRIETVSEMGYRFKK